MSKSTMLNLAANKWFNMMLEEMGVKYDAKTDMYRDNKGRFVSRSVLFNNETEDFNVNDTKDYDSNTTWEYDKIEDVLPPLPNWSNMDLAELVASTCYVKWQNLNGVLVKLPMKDASGNLIPVRKGQDGGEIGVNKWSKDSPEEVFSNRAAYWGQQLADWGYDVATLDAMIEKAEIGIDVESVVNEWAQMFAEAEVEKYQNRLEEYNKAFNRWLVSVFGIDKAREVKKLIKQELDIKVCEAENLTIEEKMEIAQSLGKSGYYSEPGNKRSWVELETGPMAVLGNEVKSLGFGARMSKETWQMAVRYFSAYFWFKVQRMDTDQPKSSKVYAIKQYAYARLMSAKLNAMAEESSPDRQIMDLKTKHEDYFRFDEADWQRYNRED